MRKSAKIALWSVIGVAVIAGSAAAGFYEGFGVGSRVMAEMAVNNQAYEALSEVRSSMVALGKNDPDLSQHQLAIHLRAALFDLGALPKTGIYVRCTDRDKSALNGAASYVASHPDPVIFNADPFLMTGIKFCERPQGGLEISKAGK